VTAGAPPIAPGSVAPESVVDAGPPASPATVTDEIALVSRAHAALTSGDPASALALLAEHARRFPNGALGEEREATRVLALCALGRTAEARDAASRFFAAFPGGPQSGRVRASCGGASPTN
jgi:outer membrane protein assembly factor BamD (BamD/ComL family)